MKSIPGIPVSKGGNAKSLKTSLTLREKAGILAFLLSLPPYVAYWSIRHFYDHGIAKTGLYDRIFSQVLRYSTASLSFAQIRVLKPAVSLEKVMNLPITKSLTKASLFENFNASFDVEGASARWIHEVPNRKREDPVILYLHGGAFFFTVEPSQLAWLGHCIRHLDKKASVLVVDYTVTPVAQFPTQLRESMAVYQQLRKSCDRIILLGDSAGGNLLCAILLELHHEVMQRPPYAAMFISPWVSLDASVGGSFKENQKYDYIDVAAIDGFSRMYATMADRFTKPLISPILGSPSLWTDCLPRLNCCIYGSKEVLSDHIKEWTEKAGIHDSFVEEGGVHDIMVYDIGLVGSNPRTQGSRHAFEKLKSWVQPLKTKL